jgi:hypothetical protein
MRRPGTDNMKWALWAALAITLLSLCPQLLMWGSRGAQWNGSYAELHGDEWVYSAYVQALIDGRPRRNDPYTGRDDRPDNPQPESLFSIQFLPAYMIAIPARALGISSSTAFIIFGVLAPFFAYLAVFWLIANVIKDRRLAAAGAVIVLGFGALAAGEGLIHLLVSGSNYSLLPFLRRYEPIAPFPLFFVFVTLVWKALHDRRFVLPVAAGLVLVLLIFSYFFLWTTAAAWLACIGLLWFVAHPEKLRRDFRSFLTIFLLAGAALVPYVILLSRRSLTMDAGQKLTLSHAPDLFRTPELIGFATIVLIVFGALRGRLNWRAPETLFAASFALTPVIVFNQQIITGRSLQPFHYGSFIVNYLVLVGLVLEIVMLWRGSESERRPIRYRWAGRLAFIAIWWAAIEVLAPAKVIIRDSQFTDRAAAVCQRLRQRSTTDGLVNSSAKDPRPLVLASDNKVAVILPTFAPQAVLWAPHFDFLNLAAGESHERFYEYLYFTGVDGDQLAKDLVQPLSTFAAAAFGHERVIPDLSVQAKPITSEEIAFQVADYKAYYSSFTRDRAVQHVLSYVIVPSASGPNLANLDRWYQRDEGEQVGNYILYRVKLRV